MAVCRKCEGEDVILDPDSGARVCTSCGGVLSSCEYQPQAIIIDGKFASSFQRIGGDFDYRDRKLYRAGAAIHELTSHLGLSATRAAEAAALVSDVTEGAFGKGEWFPVLIAACSYLVARRHRLPLSLSEAAAAINCDSCDLGRMVARVVRHLDLPPLPEFDAANALERAVKECSSFAGIDQDKAKELIGQGQFLFNCATKWSLTTGRQPLAMVAAILAFVAEVNGVRTSLEDISKEIHAKTSTSNLRHKELMGALISVARSLLPWGKDVTVRNLVQNTPLLIRLMERKSKSDLSEGLGFDLNSHFTSLRNDDYDSKYFNNGEDDGMASSNDMGGVKLSAESTSGVYQKFLKRFSHLKKDTGELDKVNVKKVRREHVEINAYQDSLSERWDAERELSLMEVLERDVGFDCPPPSFVAGVQARRFRRARIEAAKRRIQKIMRPFSNIDRVNEVVEDCVHEQTVGKRRRKKKQDNVLDWEDCIIEILLLHQVKEDEIEEGHYNRLLDLHVFNLL